MSEDYDFLSVVHIGMETFGGPDFERARFQKIQASTESIDPSDHKLSWIFCHFFQSYSTPTQEWVFDETVQSLTPYIEPIPPLARRLLVVAEDTILMMTLFIGSDHYQIKLAEICCESYSNNTNPY